MEWIDAQFLDGEISAFGHRVVHGGETFTAPVLVTDEVMEELEQLIPLAPLHQPYNLKLIEVCQQLVPSAIQVASFDTMFHHGHAPEEKYYAIPGNTAKQVSINTVFTACLMNSLIINWKSCLSRTSRPIPSFAISVPVPACVPSKTVNQSLPAWALPL